MNYKTLSNANLMQEMHVQVKNERDAGIRVLHCLREIEERGLPLLFGFASLHEYMVRELRYSDGAAHRRISSMRLLKELPQVEEKLAQGQVSLTTVSQLQNFLRNEKIRGVEVAPAQKLELLEAISDKSARQAQALLAEKFPDAPFLVQVQVSREVLEKLDELKALLAHGLDSVNGYSDVIAKIADRVLKEERKRLGSESKVSEKDADKASAQKRLPGVALRRLVWKRAGHQCQYLARDGRRCSSRFALEVDHIQAWRDGGATEADNLRLLCRAHHRLRSKGVTKSSSLERAKALQ